DAAHRRRSGALSEGGTDRHTATLGRDHASLREQFLRLRRLVQLSRRKPTPSVAVTARRRRARVSSMKARAHAAGLAKRPCASVTVSGNCDTRKTPARIGLMKSM